MKDSILIRMLEETCDMLKHVDAYVSCTHLIPSYNAILLAAQANHPTDPFLHALVPIQVADGTAGSTEIRVLFAQVRIALESAQGEAGNALTVPRQNHLAQVP